MNYQHVDVCLGEWACLWSDLAGIPATGRIRGVPSRWRATTRWSCEGCAARPMRCRTASWVVVIDARIAATTCVQVCREWRRNAVGRLAARGAGGQRVSREGVGDVVEVDQM